MEGKCEKGIGKSARSEENKKERKKDCTSRDTLKVKKIKSNFKY